MRIVAKAQLFSQRQDADVFKNVTHIVESWIDRKYVKSDGSLFAKRTGGQAFLNGPVITSIGGSEKFLFQTRELLQTGELVTSLVLVRNSKGISLLYKMLMGAGAKFVLPIYAQIRLSNFFKEIVDLDLGWQVSLDGDRVFNHCFEVSKEEASSLVDLISSPKRRLPIICFSKYVESALSADLPSKFADQLKGLAHVCQIDEDAAWELTRLIGKEWSCFNGAVRIYWPTAGISDSPFRHPIFTQANLQKRSLDYSADSQLEKLVSTRVFEASCNLSDDVVFTEFDRQIVDDEISKARESAQDTNDYSQLADLYARDNDKLRAEIDEMKTANNSLSLAKFQLEIEVDELKSQKEDLLAALRTTGFIENQSQKLIDRTPARTVVEAVESAMKRYKDYIFFGDNVNIQASRARQNSGPPDKIFRFLEVLAELSNEYQIKNGALGKTIVEWLKEKSVECSGESDTRKAQGLYRWPIDGVSQEFELHLKPNEGTSPDRCIRIYFSVQREKPCVIVGFIGSKADLER